MSIFGDLETPVAKTPEPAAKQLVDLSIKPHTNWQADRRSPVLPVVQGALDVPTSAVSLRAEAKIAFSDGTAGEGVKVTFFLNGNRLRDVETDDFGLAIFDEAVPAKHFTMNLLTDELTARVRGFAREASVKVTVCHKQLRVTISHRWEKVIHRPHEGCYGPNHLYERYENLLMEMAGDACPQGRFSVGGMPIIVQRCVQSTDWKTIATSRLDAGGKCIMSLPDYYWDDQECIRAKPNSGDIPHNVALSFYPAGGGSYQGFRVIYDGWQGAAYAPLHHVINRYNTVMEQ